MSLKDEYPKDYCFDGKMAALSHVSSKTEGTGADRVCITTRTYTFADNSTKDVVDEVASPEAAPVVPEKKSKAKPKAKRKGIFGGKKKK